jgi:hypothetical protein
MREHPEGKQPSPESNLDSAEYRERLMRKLNCLISVLEMAQGKVRIALAGPAPDTQRLLRIRRNLQETLDVCLRARGALEKRGALPPGLSKDLARAVDAEPRLERSPRGSRVEMRSEQELQRFRAMGRIDRRRVRACDLEDLARRLQG